MTDIAQPRPRTMAADDKQETNVQRFGRILSTALMYLVLTVFALFAMAPFVWMILQSFMTRGETITRRLLPGAFTDPSPERLATALGNYSYAWDQANFDVYFRNSVIIALITIAGTVVFSVLAAYAFARMEFPGKNLIFYLFLATIMIPDTVLLIPNFLIVNWISNLTWPGTEQQILQWTNSWPAQTIPFFASAFSIFLLRQFFAQIPKDLWEAARLDGSSHLNFLLQIVLPLSVPPILTVVLFTFIESWNALAWPLLVTNSPEWRPIAVGLQAFLDESGPDQHLLMAGSVITMAPILIMYFLFQKQFIENLSRTGIKG